jgi:threonine dehydrogenase-like Zn-dependent dehydrogenase
MKIQKVIMKIITTISIDEERRKRQEDEKGIFDVAIIGAGFVGLSSALPL